MRIAALAVSTALLGLVLAAPFINVLALGGGARWLAAYGVVAAMGLSPSALAVALTVALFRTIGPKRTRLVAQIVAAVIGAAFVIGLQIAAILSYGTLSRFALLQSERCSATRRRSTASLWWPARAALGDLGRARRRARRGLAAAGARGRGVLAPLRRACHRRRRHRLRQRRQRAGGGFRGGSPRARCGTRNGRCCGATPG